MSWSRRKQGDIFFSSFEARISRSDEPCPSRARGTDWTRTMAESRVQVRLVLFSLLVFFFSPANVYFPCSSSRFFVPSLGVTPARPGHAVCGAWLVRKCCWWGLLVKRSRASALPHRGSPLSVACLSLQRWRTAWTVIPARRRSVVTTGEVTSWSSTQRSRRDRTSSTATMGRLSACPWVLPRLAAARRLQ